MAEGAGSADMDTHTKTNQILYHPADLAADGSLAKPDERITTADEPGHDDLCEREQRFLMKAIDEDLDLGDHMEDAVKTLRDRARRRPLGAHRRGGEAVGRHPPALSIRGLPPPGIC